MVRLDVSLLGYSQYSLTEQLTLQSVEIHKILLSKQFFKNVVFSRPLTIIALSGINGGFLTKLLFQVVQKVQYLDYAIFV